MIKSGHVKVNPKNHIHGPRKQDAEDHEVGVFLSNFLLLFAFLSFAPLPFLLQVANALDELDALDDMFKAVLK
jgi:hypothetical protein